MIRAAMIALAMAAANAPGLLPFGDLPPQRMTPGSCAMFLWERQGGRRIAMIAGNPAVMTLLLNGRLVGLPGRPDGDAATVLGFAPRSTFRSAAMTISLDLAIAASEVGGAIIRDGTLTYTPDGGDAVVAPVVGLIGCQP